MNRRKFITYMLCGATVPLTGSYSVLIEPKSVQVNHYRIPVAGLPASFNGFRLAHLTDLHLGFMTTEKFLEGVIARTNRLKPDAIVCTGDYVHGRNSADNLEKVWPILAKLEARYGVYSVLGNHEHWAGLERSMYWLERTGQNLRHLCKPIYKGRERIVLGGAGDLWEDDLNIDKAFSSSDQDDCRILLSHNPDSLDTEFKTSLSLAICGHTHGGQVVIPFYGPPILPVKNKRYASGLIDAGKTKMFISRGIGWAIYPVRLNCPPEIAVLELVQPEIVA